jgi:hypothetical protein
MGFNIQLPSYLQKLYEKSTEHLANAIDYFQNGKFADFLEFSKTKIKQMVGSSVEYIQSEEFKQTLREKWAVLSRSPWLWTPLLGLGGYGIVIYITDTKTKEKLQKFINAENRRRQELFDKVQKDENLKPYQKENARKLSLLRTKIFNQLIKPECADRIKIQSLTLTESAEQYYLLRLVIPLLWQEILWMEDVKENEKKQNNKKIVDDIPIADLILIYYYLTNYKTYGDPKDNPYILSHDKHVLSTIIDRLGTLGLIQKNAVPTDRIQRCDYNILVNLQNETHLIVDANVLIYVGNKFLEINNKPIEPTHILVQSIDNAIDYFKQNINPFGFFLAFLENPNLHMTIFPEITEELRIPGELSIIRDLENPFTMKMWNKINSFYFEYPKSDSGKTIISKSLNDVYDNLFGFPANSNILTRYFKIDPKFSSALL